MTDFKIGDRVRVISEFHNEYEYSPMNGSSGTIVDLDRDSDTYPFLVKLDEDGDTDWVHSVERLVVESVKKEELREWIAAERKALDNEGPFGTGRANILGRLELEFDLKPKPKKVRFVFEADINEDEFGYLTLSDFLNDLVVEVELEGVTVTNKLIEEV